MFETYRMLGEQQEAELIRQAEKPARGATAPRRSLSGRRRLALASFVAAIVQHVQRSPAQQGSNELGHSRAHGHQPSRR